MVAVLVAGCTPTRAHPASVAEPTRSEQAAVAAGGACRLLDYDVVDRILGVRFEVAAASQSANSFSCVLQVRTASYPDLILTVTPTKVDVKAFRASVMPKGAATVAQLGKVGYSSPAPALDGAGPGMEVGWLAGNSRLIVLRYHLAPGAAPEATTAVTPRLVQLAIELDTSSL
jgi:hypothetical protein